MEIGIEAYASLIGSQSVPLSGTRKYGVGYMGIQGLYVKLPDTGQGSPDSTAGDELTFSSRVKIETKADHHRLQAPRRNCSP
jgi:hypothetical protein